MEKSDKKALHCLHIHPFDWEHHSIGEWTLTPKDITDLKENDPEAYKKKIDEIVEILKNDLAEESKKHMKVVIHDKKIDEDKIHAATIGVSLELW